MKKQAARNAYTGARRDLAGRVTPEAVAETLVALNKEGSRLAAQVREVTLVEEALAGRRWRPQPKPTPTRGHAGPATTPPG